MAFEDQDVARVSARLTGPDGDDIVNVWHFALETVATGGDDDVIEDIIQQLERVYSDLDNIMSLDVDFADVTIYIEGKDDSFPPQAWVSRTTGAAAGENMPAGVAMLGLMSTGTKRVVGRKYIGGMVEANWDDGVWATAALADLYNGLTKFAAPYTCTNGTELVGGIWSKTGESFHLITSVRTLEKARYQRRRRQGKGS